MISKVGGMAVALAAMMVDALVGLMVDKKAVDLVGE